MKCSRAPLVCGLQCSTEHLEHLVIMMCVWKPVFFVHKHDFVHAIILQERVVYTQPVGIDRYNFRLPVLYESVDPIEICCITYLINFDHVSTSSLS